MTTEIINSNTQSIVEPTTSNGNEQNWTSKKDTMAYFHCSDKTIERFIQYVKDNSNNFNINIDVDIKKVREGRSFITYYSDNLLKQFQVWLLKNQTNQGRSSSLVKQVATNAVVTELEEKWYTVKEICEACGVTDRTFRRFKEESSSDSTVQSKILSHNLKQYPESVLKQFQIWLKKNTLNAGGQNWTSKKDAMAYFHCSDKTIENFIKEVNDSPNNFNIEFDFDIKKGGYRNLEVYYSDNLLKQFQIWLEKNQINQGVQCAAKQEAIGDMAIGFVMTKGSYEQRCDMIAFLQAQNEQQHQTEVAYQQERLKSSRRAKVIEVKNAEITAKDKRIEFYEQELETDRTKHWVKWSTLKSTLNKPKPNFDRVVNELALVEEVDYIEKPVNGEQYCTIFVEPTVAEAIKQHY